MTATTAIIVAIIDCTTPNPYLSNPDERLLKSKLEFEVRFVIIIPHPHQQNSLFRVAGKYP